MKRKITKIITFLFFLTSSITFGQMKGGYSIDTKELLIPSTDKISSQNDLIRKESNPVGNPVIAEYYLIGPGDVLSFLVTSLSPVEQPIIVSPENLLMIPRIGLINTAGKTLYQVKKEIYDSIKSRIPDAIVSISLSKPRDIIVTITGDVTFPGTYIFPASYRLSTGIKIVNQKKIGAEVYNQQAYSLYKLREKESEAEKPYSESGLAGSFTKIYRNIIIHHSDGSSTTADMEKASVIMDAQSDPYLREGDVINIPYENYSAPQITISGAVYRPCQIPFKTSDKASFLLKAGYSFRDGADLSNIILLFPEEGKSIKLRSDSLMNLIGSDIKLTAGCAIIVGEKKITNTNPFGLVAVKGNVNSPGVYPIKSGQTKLKDVIDMAGGFTLEAYLPASYILRRETNGMSTINPRLNAMKLFQYSDLTLDDTSRYNLHSDYMSSMVSCDFDKLFNSNSGTENVRLDDGDLIVVPSTPKRVYVFGQVNQPGYIEFVPNKTLSYYVEKAGGYAQGAEKGRSRIIRAKTKVWIEGTDDVMVMAGDNIYVPPPPDISTALKLQTYSVYASLMATTVGIIAFILSTYQAYNK
ncbi:MAG: hypothetical protein HW421_1242 [Ignavibacteria bacterium]|nr:hypothetical protein [Ignavibacteria bacterium]